MNIRILCVGKMKESYYALLAEEFIKRLGRYCVLTVVETPDEKVPESLSAAEQRRAMDREGERLCRALKGDEYVVALAIGGKRYTSQAFSEHLTALFDSGKSTVAFVIGGSLGLSEGILARADERLSLSDMTLPHRIARIVLLEQVYRAFKIARGETYHK